MFIDIEYTDIGALRQETHQFQNLDEIYITIGRILSNFQYTMAQIEGSCAVIFKNLNLKIQILRFF